MNKNDFTLSRGNTSFVFHTSNGTYDFLCGPFQLKELTPALTLNEKAEPFGKWKAVKATASAMTLQAAGKRGTWELKAELSANEKLTLSMTGKLKDPCEDIGAWYFCNAVVPAEHLAIQGLCTGGGELIPLNGKGMQKKEFKGGCALVITRKKQQLTLSFPLRGEYLETFQGNAVKGKAESFQAGFAIKHIINKTIKLKPLTFRVGDGFQALYAYGDENCTEKRDFTKIAVPGWNSWDYYRWTINEDEVLENAEFIAKDPVLSKHVKKIIVDDGWQYAYGEWKANSYFPHGMKWLAGKIKKLGFKPGLWIAPTIVEPHAWIAQMEPDMLAKAENGQPTLCFDCMKRNAFVMDPTVPRVQKFIYDLFDSYATDGYEYFKLDFLASTCTARQFTDKKIGRGRLMDLTIGIARKAIGNRAQILGCGYMFSGGQDPVDMARIGGDVHARWGSIKENTASIATRFWANKKLWVNDPDFALCRAFDTANDPMLTQMLCCLVFVKPDETDPDFAPGKWTLVDIHRPQAEVLLSIVIAAGGAVNLSDKMTRLNESGLDLARRTVSAESGDAAIPLDLFSQALPKYWVQRVNDSKHRVLLINWEDAPAALRLDLKPFGIADGKMRNFWNDKSVRAKGGVIEEEIAPRSCLFVEITGK